MPDLNASTLGHLCPAIFLAILLYGNLRRFLLPFVRPYGGLSWYLASLSPTSAASLFAASLVNWERMAAGVRWHTLWLPVTQGSGYCVGSVMWLLMVDVLLFATLTWYCDKVGMVVCCPPGR